VQVEKGMIISSKVQTLNGTVAIVTGASSGIGEATAKQLAELGATVAVVARRGDRLKTLVTEIEAAGGSALAVTADITERVQAERAVQTVIDRFGRLDILINNAGLMLLGSVLDQQVEEWERMIAVRVCVLEPGAVETELISHNNDTVKDHLAVSDAENIPEKLQPEDIAESIAYMVTRHRRSSIAELWAMPTSQA